MSESIPHLSVNIRHSLGVLNLDVTFALKEPWTVLFGPSGSGKTTVLRSISGFVHPDEGSITCGDQILLNRSANIFVPAHRRPVRSAGQMARLFPNLTVRENAVYGSGWNSKPDDVMGIAEQVMEIFRVKDLEDRGPRDLSGGERQRVSVVRTVVSAVTFDGPGKALVLLDEPFSGLDAEIREDLLLSLRQWLQRWKIPVLLVTHDVGEAFQLGAEVIKIADGRVVQQGPVATVLASERERLMQQLNASKGSPA